MLESETNKIGNAVKIQLNDEFIPTNIAVYASSIFTFTWTSKKTFSVLTQKYLLKLVGHCVHKENSSLCGFCGETERQI